MSDKTPEETPKRPRKSATPQIPPIPAEMLDALGGRPIAVPSMVARRISVSSPVPGAPAPVIPARVTNPLFDDVSPDHREAAKSLRLVRSAFGKVAHHMDDAARLFRSALDLPGIDKAAALEGFDIEAATAVAREFEDFLDRYKPQEAVKPVAV